MQTRFAGRLESSRQKNLSTGKDGDDQTLSFHVTPAGLAEKSYVITAVANYDGREYKEGYHTVGYAGLRPYNLYRASTYRTTGVDAKVAPGLNVGYIVGAGDDVPQSLVNLGINVHFLTPTIWPAETLPNSTPSSWACAPTQCARI